MDEIEFRNAYLETVSLLDSFPNNAPIKRILQLLLSMSASTEERVTEMQETEDDDE